MNQYDIIKSFLEKHERARERKNKQEVIAFLLINKYDLAISKDKLADILAEASSLDRMWRKVTEDNEYLRGTDYDTKMEVEQKAQINLGYSPGFHKDLKVKETLF